jgi:hypothetical protein
MKSLAKAIHPEIQAFLYMDIPEGKNGNKGGETI